MTPAIAIAVVLIGIFGFALTKPNTLRVRRVAEIKAPPERIFSIINDFHHWPSWAPQDRMDPTMKRTYGEIASGKGASSAWVSHGKAGCGRMEITESTAHSRITVQVDFARPIVARNINEFTLQPLDEVTRVTWTMHGTNPYIAKVMSTFINLDRMLGKHFESGLQGIKALSEG